MENFKHLRDQASFTSKRKEAKVQSRHLTQMRSALLPYFKHRLVSTKYGRVALWDSHPNAPKNTPTLIFLHGYCTNKEFFRKQLTWPLFTNYRLIAIDLPGFGESDPATDAEKVYSFPGFADAVTDTALKMELKNLVIIGWSLGGHIALELASRLSQIKGLLMTGTPPIEISEHGLSQGFKALDSKLLECFGKENIHRKEAELLATISGYDFSEKTEFLVDAILQADEGARTIYPRSIPKGRGNNQLDIVKNWPKPIAVIAGISDMVINNDYLIQQVTFRNLWEGKVHLLKGGHALFMEYPEEFNLIMLRFIQDIFQS